MGMSLETFVKRFNSFVKDTIDYYLSVSGASVEKQTKVQIQLAKLLTIITED